MHRRTLRVATVVAGVVAMVSCTAASAVAGGGRQVDPHAAAREAANAAAEKYFPLKPAEFGSSSSRQSGSPEVNRDLPDPPPVWVPSGVDATHAGEYGHLLPMGYGIQPSTSVNANSLFFGAPMPLYLGYAIGQHNNFGQYESIQCSFEPWTDTPYAYQSDFRNITFGSTVQCNSPNVTGWGATNLGEFQHSATSVPSLQPLVASGNQYTVYGHGTYFDNPPQSYYRVNDTQLVQVYQFFSLTVADGGNGGDGWLTTPPAAQDIQGGAARCTILARRMDCVIVSDPFAFAPDEVQNCSARPECQQANALIDSARQTVANAQSQLNAAIQQAQQTAQSLLGEGEQYALDNPTAVPDNGQAEQLDLAANPGVIVPDVGPDVPPAPGQINAASIPIPGSSGCHAEAGHRVEDLNDTLRIHFGGGFNCEESTVTLRLKSEACLLDQSHSRNLGCVGFGQNDPNPNGPIDFDSYVRSYVDLINSRSARAAKYRIDVTGTITIAQPNTKWGVAPDGCKIISKLKVDCLFSGKEFKGRPKVT
jgi:hypothetical protein